MGVGIVLAGRGAVHALAYLRESGSFGLRNLLQAFALLAALATANCAQQKAASGRQIDPKYGVAASPRVVGENDPVPKGGGREVIGKPYVVAGRVYVPRENTKYVAEGLASWYGTAFHGRLTANGEVFDRTSVAAAHPTLPLPSYVRVTNVQNGRSMIVRVNDRGPYHGNRIMDVSQRVAEALDFRRVGTARVRVEYVGRASINGSDDNKLMATLRIDGAPAPFPGRAHTMVADLGESVHAPPRQALAFREALPSRSDQPDETSGTVASHPGSPPPAPLVVARADDTPEERNPAPVPLPPERPLNLGRGLGAKTSAIGAGHLPVAQAAPVRRSVYAGLL